MSEKFITLPERKRRKDKATEAEISRAIREERDGLITAIVLPAEEINCREASMQDMLDAIGYREVSDGTVEKASSE